MKSKLSWIPFIPLSLIGCFSKLAQGFLPEGTVLGLSNLVLDYIFMGCVALIFLFALLFCLIDRKISAYYLSGRNIPASFFGILTAVTAAADGANSLFHMFSSGQIEAVSIIQAALLLLSAIVFIVFGMNHSFRNNESKRFALFYALPALLCAVRMIECFTRFTTVSIRLADVSALICYVLATMFFYNYAVMLSLTRTKNAVRFCLMFGLPASAALIPYGLSRLIFSFDSLNLFDNLWGLEALLLGLYILSFVIELTARVRDEDGVMLIEEEISLDPVEIDENVDGFVVKVSADEDEDTDNSAYLLNTNTEDYLYREIKQDETEHDERIEEAAMKRDVEGYLTDKENEQSEEDKPALTPYEERMDAIDKLIIEISSQSD